MIQNRIRLWAAAFWLAVWQLASICLDSDILLVSPVRVLIRLGQLSCTAPFWKAICFTLVRIAAGFFMAAAAGCALAAAASCFRVVRELAAPVILAVKSVPVASFIILALIWFSSKNLSVLISFLMVLPVIYTSVLGGIMSVDQRLLEMAQVFCIPGFRVARYIYLPHVLPFFYSACSVSLGLGWKAGVAAEVIGMPRGSVGERLQQAKVYLDTPDLFAWTLVIVVMSLMFERLVLVLLKKAARRLTGSMEEAKR